jgi:hypothetical protein
LGVISLADIVDVGAEPLISELKIEADLAQKLVAAATKEVERLAEKPKKEEAQEQPVQETEAGDSK